MYDDELLGSPELTELEAKYKSIWAGLPEAAAMPRELEAVGGVLAAMVLGGSTGGVAGPRDPHEEYFAFAAEDLDHEVMMLFGAGKLAISWMCGTNPDVPPLAPFSIRLVARIAEEFLGNREEILRLARLLKEEECLDDCDVGSWTRSGQSAGGEG
ncbi:MAG: hypothetical protein WBP56_02535 [Polyangia bacterium]